MNWDAVFITLGSAALAIAGIGFFVGPLYVEEWLDYKSRAHAYKMGVVIIPALVLTGALLLGLGVPT